MFIQPCFIRENTSELRKKLEELGYEYHGTDILYGTPCNLYCSFGSYFEISSNSKPSRFESVIDCGNNEELFIALVALRDDTDVNQWFTDGKLWEKSNNDLPSNYMQLEGHKATVKEIIEHFKNKDNV